MAKKKFFLIIGIVVAVLLAVYFCFAIYFSSHFYFGSTVNGVNSSGKSVDDVKQALSNKTKNYSLTLKESGDCEERLSSKDAGLTVSFDGGEVDEILDGQNPLEWVSGAFAKKKYESKNIVRIDEGALESGLQNLDCVKNSAAGTQTENATYEYKDGEFKIKDEVYGTNIDMDTFEKNVKSSMMNFKASLNLTSSNSYVQPEVTKDSDELVSLVDEMNKRLNMNITFSDVNETIPKDVLAGFITTEDDKNIQINSDAVKEYVDSLAKKYNTAGHPKELHTSYGKDVTITNGDYGWRLDKDTEIAALSDEVQKGDDVSRELNWKTTAASHTGNDYGNSYVEINLTAQHLFLYVNGSKYLETDVVTGNPNKGKATPTGAYGITYCEKNATLSGQDYSVPVSYWMPFCGNVGMHDAPWKSRYGSDLYLTNGSRGCVNLPVSVAPKIFAQVKKNFPVLVYTLPGTGSSINTDAANAVISKINAIGNVTLESEGAINEARSAYDALDSASKTAVSNYSTLKNAESSLAALKKQAADAEKASENAADQTAPAASGQPANDTPEQPADTTPEQPADTVAQQPADAASGQALNGSGSGQ